MSEKLLEVASEIIDLRNQYTAKLEVVQELTDLKTQLEGKLQELTDLTKSEVSFLRKNEVVIKGNETSEKGTRKRSTKSMGDLVLDVLDKNDNLSLKEISKEIQNMIDNKEYETASDNVPNLVSQALNKLKSKGLVVASASTDSNKRQVYSKVKSNADAA